MPKIDEDEAQIFRAAMQGVRRLRAEERAAPPPPPRPTPRPVRAPEAPRHPSLQDPLDDGGAGGLVSEYARPGLQKGVLQRLRRGQYPVQAQIDLHGFTRIQAKEALVDFLQACHERRLRCVRVIHGKGRRPPAGVLQRCVPAWLTQLEMTLAFCRARPEDGGSGALYVLLRR